MSQDEADRERQAAVAKPLDPRRHAYRADLAAVELRDRVVAPRYAEGVDHQVVWSAVPLRSRPQATAPFDSEALHGEHVTVYDLADGWAWGQLRRDGYVGYLPLAGLSRNVRKPTHKVRSLGTFVYPEASIKTPPLMHLSLGAELSVAQSVEGFHRLASGGYVVPRHVVEVDRYARDFAEVAERFIGTPYLWGGRTRIGIDCSGLVQVSLAAAGIPAPRDSDMQCAELGEAISIPSNLEGLCRGDLVFWKGHVGIMLDGVMLLHANAHHMAVAIETLQQAVERIERSGGAITTIRPVAGTDYVRRKTMAQGTTSGGAEPLTASQISALWQAERRSLRLYAVAVTILAAALGLSHLAIVPPELRYLLLLGALLLVIAAIVVHLAIRCPRCNARLGAQSLMLPGKCKSCGVEIAHPRGLDGELDA